MVELDLETGQRLFSAIQAAIEAADVVLVVIDQAWWAQISRLHDPEDYHRGEIATALKMGKHVVPVLMEDVDMPASHQLPTEIAGLANLADFRIHHAFADENLKSLADDLRRRFGGPKARLNPGLIGAAWLLLTGALSLFPVDVAPNLVALAPWDWLFSNMVIAAGLVVLCLSLLSIVTRRYYLASKNKLGLLAPAFYFSLFYAVLGACVFYEYMALTFNPRMIPLDLIYLEGAGLLWAPLAAFAGALLSGCMLLWAFKAKLRPVDKEWRRPLTTRVSTVVWAMLPMVTGAYILGQFSQVADLVLSTQNFSRYFLPALMSGELPAPEPALRGALAGFLLHALVVWEYQNGWFRGLIVRVPVMASMLAGAVLFVVIAFLQDAFNRDLFATSGPTLVTLPSAGALVGYLLFTTFRGMWRSQNDREDRTGIGILFSQFLRACLASAVGVLGITFIFEENNSRLIGDLLSQPGAALLIFALVFGGLGLALLLIWRLGYALFLAWYYPARKTFFRRNPILVWMLAGLVGLPLLLVLVAQTGLEGEGVGTLVVFGLEMHFQASQALLAGATIGATLFVLWRGLRWMWSIWGQFRYRRGLLRLTGSAMAAVAVFLIAGAWVWERDRHLPDQIVGMQTVGARFLTARVGPSAFVHVYEDERPLGIVRGHRARVHFAQFVDGGTILRTHDVSGLVIHTDLQRLVALPVIERHHAYVVWMENRIWAPVGRPVWATITNLVNPGGGA